MSLPRQMIIVVKPKKKAERLCPISVCQREDFPLWGFEFGRQDLQQKQYEALRQKGYLKMPWKAIWVRIQCQIRVFLGKEESSDFSASAQRIVGR